MFEQLINKDIYDELSDVAKNQIDVACLANITTSLAEGEATNYAAMVDNTENNGVTIKQWPPEMLEQFQSAWDEIAAEFAEEDEFFKKVWDDLSEYREGYDVWSSNIYLPRK